MEYKLLLEDTASDLSALVSQYVTSGWNLYGNPTMTAATGKDGNIYYACAQAVVRYESGTITVALGTDVKHFDVLGEVTIGE